MPTAVIPTGRYFVSNRGLPLAPPSEPGEDIVVPIVPKKVAWYLKDAPEEVQRHNQEDKHYILGTDDHHFYLTQDGKRVTTSAKRADALVIVLELPVFKDVAPKDSYKFSVKGNLLTVSPPGPDVVGIAGFVEFWPPADGDDKKQLWVLEPAPPGGES